MMEVTFTRSPPTLAARSPQTSVDATTDNVAGVDDGDAEGVAAGEVQLASVKPVRAASRAIGRARFMSIPSR